MLPTLCLWTLVTGKGNDSIQMIKFILLAFSYFSMIGYIITIKDQNVLKRIFKSKPLTFTGKISYGLYVYHPLCFGLMSSYYKNGNVLVHFILSFILSYLVASLSFYFFESKFSALKQKFEYN